MSANPTPSVNIGACSLFTQAEAAAALGEAAVTLVTNSDKTMCNYSASDGSTLAVSVAATTASARPWASLPSSEDIAGLGDQAYWDSTGLLLAVRKGNVELDLQAGQDLLGQGGYMEKFESLAGKHFADHY